MNAQRPPWHASTRRNVLWVVQRGRPRARRVVQAVWKVLQRRPRAVVEPAVNALPRDVLRIDAQTKYYMVL